MLNMIEHGEPTDKPGLLIAHGLYGSARNWGVIAKRLADSRRVVAVDLRNHGSSPWYDTHGYEDMAEDLAEVVRSLGGTWDVLGHSMGGKAAMMLALTTRTSSTGWSSPISRRCPTRIRRSNMSGRCNRWI